MANVTPKAIDLHCKVSKQDFLRVFSVVPDTIEVAINYTGQPPRVVRIGKEDALRLQAHIAQVFPTVPKAPRPPASSVHKTIAGLGGKELVFDAGNSNGQTTLAIGDGYTIHHIVLNEQAVAELHTLVSKEVFRLRPQVMAATPATPNWNDNPGTLCIPMSGYTDPFEVCLVEDNTKVDLNWDPEMSGLRFGVTEVDGLIKHLQHCRHQMHGLVRVKEVPDYSGPAPKPTYVVMDMQGEPKCVLHSEPAVAQYLSTNKLRVAQ